MPVITLQMAGTATREQKAQIVKEFTDTMVNVLGKNPQRTHVIITEKSTEDWGFAGELIADINAKQAKS
jgi:4-oxalocrotonate tautomerase